MKPYDVHFETDDVTVYLAAAGAGKTTALMGEFTKAIDAVRPDEVGMFTFTKKGVSNFVDRALSTHKHLTVDDLPYVQTLHAMAFRESGLRHKNIIELRDIRKFNEMTGFHLNLAAGFDNQTDDDKLMQRYDAIRSGAERGVFMEAAIDEERYERMVRAYEVFKRENDLVDFFDCLTRFLETGRALPVKRFMVDEAQDLTVLHWKIVEMASRNAETVIIAGDDFQSLFRYAGASPETLIHIAGKHKTVKLETSYRLPKAVYRFARGITEMITAKIDKDYMPAEDREGFVEEIGDRDVLARIARSDIENNGYKPNRWYHLFRANHFIADMADRLEQYSVPFHTTRGFCIPERELSRIHRYHNYRKEGYGSIEARERFANEYKVTNFELEFIHSELIPSERRFVYNDYVKKWGVDQLMRWSKSDPYILLATTYKVKGGECDYCAVFLDITKLVSQNTVLDLDSELRVLYVACTRPREGLYLVSSEGYYGHDEMIRTIKELVHA